MKTLLELQTKAKQKVKLHRVELQTNSSIPLIHRVVKTIKYESIICSVPSIAN